MGMQLPDGRNVAPLETHILQPIGDYTKRAGGIFQDKMFQKNFSVLSTRSMPKDTVFKKFLMVILL